VLYLSFHIFAPEKIKYLACGNFCLKGMKKMTNESSRTSSSIKNLRASTAGIFINLIFSFFSRKIFVLVLGKEYVGLSSLIGNITALISLVDFGASTAVTYRLYRALATGDDRSVCAYLHFYRRICALS
jgi:hypothetical protein